MSPLVASRPGRRTNLRHQLATLEPERVLTMQGSGEFIVHKAGSICGPTSLTRRGDACFSAPLKVRAVLLRKSHLADPTEDAIVRPDRASRLAPSCRAPLRKADSAVPAHRVQEVLTEGTLTEGPLDLLLQPHILQFYVATCQKQARPEEKPATLARIVGAGARPDHARK